MRARKNAAEHTWMLNSCAFQINTNPVLWRCKFTHFFITKMLSLPMMIVMVMALTLDGSDCYHSAFAAIIFLDLQLVATRFTLLIVFPCCDGYFSWFTCNLVVRWRAICTQHWVVLITQTVYFCNSATIISFVH